MGGLHVIHPQAVHQHQRLLEVGAANGQVSLNPVGGALLQID